MINPNTGAVTITFDDSNDIVKLRDCIAFVIDNDTDCDAIDIENLQELNSFLLQSL